MTELALMLGGSATVMAAIMTFVMWRVSKSLDRKYGRDADR